jgi:hypothetical protein
VVDEAGLRWMQPANYKLTAGDGPDMAEHGLVVTGAHTEPSAPCRLFAVASDVDDTTNVMFINRTVHLTI